MSDVSKNKPVDKLIPWFFVFFFLVIAVLDGIFVTMAIRTHTGTVTDRPYEEGLAYNETLKAVDEQAALGWAMDISLDTTKKLRVTLLDEDGRALDNALLIAKFTRPVQEGYDFEIPLTSMNESGVYAGRFEVPLKGRWQVRIFAEWQDQHYQQSKMFLIR